jgi:uncharacterized protein YgiM (DUF1202 family)
MLTMRRFAWMVLAALLPMTNVWAEEEYPVVEVAEPFIELHTGPGRGFPVFYVVERGDEVEVIKRKTDWFKVRTAKGKVGWVKRAQMEKTLDVRGQTTQVAEAGFGDFSKRRWEVGLMGGDFNQTPIMTLFGGYAFNKNLLAEVSFSQVLGDFSSSEILNVNLISQPFPQWRFSPYFSLGVGHINTEPKATLVQVKDSSDTLAHVAGGMRIYLTRRFILRVEYKDYVVFSSDDNNEEFEEWQAGFAFFF